MRAGRGKGEEGSGKSEPRTGKAAQLILAFALILLFTSCGGNKKALELRLWSDSYAFRVTEVPMPPRALETVIYRVVVQDKKTGQPIETGEGRIFMTSPDRASTNDGFKKEKELGTYSARLFFPTVGDWAAAIQFRRDTNLPLERVDWIQTVHAATEPGSSQ